MPSPEEPTNNPDDISEMNSDGKNIQTPSSSPENDQDKKGTQRPPNAPDRTSDRYEYKGNDERWDCTCFVIMPYGSKGEYSRGVDESDYVYNHIICPAVNEFEKETKQKVKVIREVENPTTGSITRSMIEHIAKSKICIVDITGLNPNVFFELGIRYSLKNKNTILLRQRATEIPFDINGYRCITYDCFKPTHAINNLLQFLVLGADDTKTTNNDSLVFEIFPNMQVHIPGILTSIGQSSDDCLSWEEWWLHIKDLVKLLDDPFTNGRFAPDVVFGISNGGLLVADLLGRELFKSSPIPILSLWANRSSINNSTEDSNCYFFDNKYNKAVMSELKKEKQGKVTVLLVDDLVFSSSTSVQASNFINRELKKNCKILFTPLYCRETSDSNLEIVEEMLPYGFKNERGKNVFNITKEEYFKMLHVRKGKFPYDKNLK